MCRSVVQREAFIAVTTFPFTLFRKIFYRASREMFGFNGNRKSLLTAMTFPVFADRTMRLFFGS